MSLRMLASAGVSAAALIDVGGGAPSLIRALLDRGFRDLTVLDISAAGMQHARDRLGSRAEQVHWLTADVLSWHSGVTTGPGTTGRPTLSWPSMSTGTGTCIPWPRPPPRTSSPSSAASHRTGRSTARACQDLDSARAGLRHRWRRASGPAHCTRRRTAGAPPSPAPVPWKAHQVAVRAEHSLLHALPRLSAALVHAGPQPRSGTDDHALLASHR